MRLGEGRGRDRGEGEEKGEDRQTHQGGGYAKTEADISEAAASQKTSGTTKTAKRQRADLPLEPPRGIAQLPPDFRPWPPEM
jgi:hypothetical protein